MSGEAAAGAGVEVRWAVDSKTGEYTSGEFATWEGCGGRWVVFAKGYKIGVAQSLKQAKIMAAEHAEPAALLRGLR